MNARQRLFAVEYVRNGKIGYQAVYAAGYKQGYNAACVTASRLLRKAKIRSMVDSAIEKANSKAKLTAERVSQEIADVAFAPVKEIDSKAKMQGLSLATQVLGMVTQKVEQTVTDNSSIQSALANRISKLSRKTGDNPQDIEKSLQIELSDKSDEDYSPDLDANVHPEIWPSGCLISNATKGLEPQQIDGEQ